MVGPCRVALAVPTLDRAEATGAALARVPRGMWSVSSWPMEEAGTAPSTARAKAVPRFCPRAVAMAGRAGSMGLHQVVAGHAAGRMFGGRSKVAGSVGGTLGAGLNIIPTRVRVLREPARPQPLS